MNIPLPADNRILYFERERDSFRCFSHFHPSPIELDGETWPTVEHYYQAQRSQDPAYRQAIRDAKTPGRAKHLSLSPGRQSKGAKRSWFRRNNALPRADWYKVKLDIMRKADWAKFTQNSGLGEILLATGNAELIEDSKWDAFWGIGSDGKGCNWAGKILMEIRQKLRPSSDPSPNQRSA